MSITYAILMALGICIVSAVSEGIGAGKKVPEFFAKLRQPRFAPPLRIWYIIGVVYYALCFFLIYRILRSENSGEIKYVSFTLLLVFMGINAFWNFIFFRARSMFLAFLIVLPYIADSGWFIFQPLAVRPNRRFRFSAVSFLSDLCDVARMAKLAAQIKITILNKRIFFQIQPFERRTVQHFCLCFLIKF